MKLPLSYRQTAALTLIAPAGLLAYGYYLQFVEGLEPCPLCMTQRICFYLIAIFSVLALITHRAKISRVISQGFIALSAIVGLGVAGRQLWLQSLPEDQVPACGPGFEYIIQTFPLMEAVSIMFRGNGNCAEVDWTFLGLSIAGWAFIAFAGFLTLSIIQLLRKAD